jgi:(hydroxyamino)benzene mutase
MTLSNLLARQSARLQQIGVGLLLFTSFWGFVFPNLASVRLGLSVHTLSALLAVLLLSLGSAWRRLVLPTMAARISFWLLVYSGLAIDAAYVLGALWGAGNETMTFAAGDARGNALQEAVIKAVAYSSGPTGIVSFALIFWGLLHCNVAALEKVDDNKSPHAAN